MASRSTSPSEGEIIESDSEKATKSLPSVNGNRVDPQSRKRRSTASRSPSPVRSPRSRSYRSRSRSPYRAPRGSKRNHDDDHYSDRYERSDRRGHRNSRANYEERRLDRPRSHHSSYHDRDRHESASSALRYDDRSSSSRQREKRLRTVSRSPPRFSDKQTDTSEIRSRSRGHSQREVRDRKSEAQAKGEFSREQSVSERGSPPGENASLRIETEQGKNQTRKGVSFKLGNRAEPDTNSGQNTTSEASSEVPSDATPLTEAELIESRRRRREAIKAKHKSQGSQSTPLLVQVLDPSKAATTAEFRPDTPGFASEAVESLRISPPTTPDGRSRSGSPSIFAPKELDFANGNQTNGDFDDEFSAADYDPTADRQEDKRREEERQHGEDMPSGTYDETKNNEQDVLVPEPDVQPPAAKKEFDMFADDADDDDMFGAPETSKVDDDQAHLAAAPVPRAAIDMSMLDDFDDAEGYYKVVIGELLDNRYAVQMNLGKGMFSAVVRAMDQVSHKLVAVKVIRNNETMRKAALKEIEILKSLMAADPDDKKHIIRLERHFEHKGHLCMVFENLSINLREVLKKFGVGSGINIRACRTYAQQIFLGLLVMRKVKIIHADLKPDNLLIDDSKTMLKVADLGSACDASEAEVTPYLVSRFYRAPEVILGLPYDFAIDVWSVGCTLFELYSGKILFSGRSNNQMLKAIMETRGKFPHKILRKAPFTPMHFDDLLNFRSMERDKVTGKEVVKILNFNKPTRDLRTRLMGAGEKDGKMTESEGRELTLFVDFLEKCLTLAPEKRITPSEALRHPFLMRSK